MENHTPGPWKILDAGPNSGNIIRFEIVWTANGTDFHSICEIEDSTIDAKNKKAAARMDEANALLIAAAPDLLEVCQNIVHLAFRDPNRKRPNEDDDFTIASTLVKHARAACAKAGLR